MNRRLFLLSSATAIALTFSGCGKVKKKKKENALEATLTAYGTAIRWAYYDIAWGYIQPDKREVRPERLDNIRVTGYDVVQPPLRTAEDKATQVVKIEYLFRDRQSIRTMTDRQEWRFDSKMDAWWLYSPFPDFK